MNVHRPGRPFHMPTPSLTVPSMLRISWHGEIWPRFVVMLANGLSKGVVLTSETLGNTLLVRAEKVDPIEADGCPPTGDAAKLLQYGV